MGLCNIKKPKVKKAQWFKDNKRFFISFDINLTYFSAMALTHFSVISFLRAWYHDLFAESV